MEYPPEFIEKVKEVYPDWEELHIALDEGKRSVGEHLTEALTRESCSCLYEIFDQNTSATDLVSLQQKIKEIEESYLAKEELHTEWSELYSNVHSKTHDL